jgi:transposase
MEAQGRGLLITHGLPSPAHWWKPQNWSRLGKLLPTWILPHLELYRPALLAFDQQVRALTIELEKAAPAALPTGMGALSSVVISREICNWQRFKNRRQVSSYTGLCPGEYSSGTKRVPGSVTKHGNRRLRAALVELAWRMVRFQPRYYAVQKRLAVLSKRSPSYRGAAQEGHCCRGSSARCGPLEASYRALLTHDPRIQVK